MVYETYTPMFSEIFLRVNNAKDKQKKIAVLKKHRSEALEMFLKSALDPRVEWLLPKGDVPYIKNEAPEGEGEQMRLAQQVYKLHNYVSLNREDLKLPPVVGNKDLNRINREKMFIQLLEGLHQDEAELVIIAKDKKLNKKYRGLNSSTVCEAFGWSEDFIPE
jgi:hypothetical protein